MPTSPQDGSELAFAFSRKKRRDWVLGLLLSLVVCPALAVYYLGYGPVAVGAGFVSDLALVLVIGGAIRNVTTVGPAGIRVRWGLLPVRTMPWSDVASIDIESETRMIKWNPQRSVRITMVDGRRFHLPTLHDGELTPDPAFYDKVEQIIDFWERYS